MGIGKSKNTQIDIDGLISEIGTVHQIEREKADFIKRLEELRNAKTTLKEATESLIQVTTSLNEAITVLNAAKDSADNIVSGICKAIVDAQENTKFKVHFEREDLEQMSNHSIAALKTDEIMMKQHRDQQLKNLEDHERKVKNLLRHNEGVWLSNFWMKVLSIVILAYSFITFLYVQIKT